MQHFLTRATRQEWLWWVCWFTWGWEWFLYCFLCFGQCSLWQTHTHWVFPVSKDHHTGSNAAGTVTASPVGLTLFCLKVNLCLVWLVSPCNLKLFTYITLIVMGGIFSSNLLLANAFSCWCSIQGHDTGIVMLTTGFGPSHQSGQIFWVLCSMVMTEQPGCFFGTVLLLTTVNSFSFITLFCITSVLKQPFLTFI